MRSWIATRGNWPGRRVVCSDVSRRAALALAVAALATATCASATSESTIAAPSRVHAIGYAEPEADVRSFPGGGHILFRPQDGPGYEHEGVGIASSDGTIRTYSSPDQNFALWDPARAGDVLLVPYAGESRAEAFTPSDEELLSAGSWRIDDGAFAAFSPDGRWIAETPFDRRDHLRTGTIRVIDRLTGEGRVLRVGDELTIGGFSPDGEIVVAPWDGGSPVLLDPVSGEVTGTLPSSVEKAATSMMTWSPDGRAIAGSICCDRSRIVIADVSGAVMANVVVGHRNVSIPTWSPDGTRVAVVVRSLERGGHRTAELIVVDAETGGTSVIDDRVSDAFWASWSPDGRWLLLDDWTRDQWLFLAADGGQRIAYPRLGDMARWCCPSSPPVSVLDPLC